MFTFNFSRIPNSREFLNITINDHVIQCPKKFATTISKTIFNSDKKKKIIESFNITIPELNDSLICSESDYQYFDNIFNLLPVRICSTNSSVLKVFASRFGIDELSSLVDIFDSFYDLITNNESLQIQKNISNELINIEESNFDELLNDFMKIEKSNNNILTLDFVYNTFLTTCIIRNTKIELLISFLKKYEEVSSGKPFEYFKNALLNEYEEYVKTRQQYRETVEKLLYDSYPSKSIYFILNYLCTIGEITEAQIEKYKSTQDQNLLKKFSETELAEYQKAGYNPSKVYHAIKDDDLNSFTEIMTQKIDSINFNKRIELCGYERNSDLLFQPSQNEEICYLELAAFYGSEKIFNYILLNINEDAIKPLTVRLAFIGGNISIIHKCVEKVGIGFLLLQACLIIAIKYNHNDIFEWLFENNASTIENNNMLVNRLLANAIKFNNIDVVIFLLSHGFDYTSLFMHSLFYNQDILARIAMKFPYKYKVTSKYFKKKEFEPYNYKYYNVFF